MAVGGVAFSQGLIERIAISASDTGFMCAGKTPEPVRLTGETLLMNRVCIVIIRADSQTFVLQKELVGHTRGALVVRRSKTSSAVLMTTGNASPILHCGIALGHCKASPASAAGGSGLVRARRAAPRAGLALIVVSLEVSCDAGKAGG